MYSSLLGVFGTCVALIGMCQAGNLDRSSLAPRSIVHTFYPYYNSDTLLGIWKPEESLQVSSDVNALGRNSKRQEAADVGARAATSGCNDRESSRNDPEESAAVGNEGTPEITYWPPVQRGVAPKPRPSNLKSDA